MIHQGALSIKPALDLLQINLFRAGHPPVFVAEKAQVAVADQAAALLIPEAEAERLEAGEERYRLDGLKERMRFVA